MDDQRDGFLFYRSYFEAAKTLNKRDRDTFFMAVCAFALDGEEPELSGTLQTVWTLVRPILETNRKRYLNGKRPKQNRTKAEAKPKQSGSVASQLSDRQETRDERQEIKDNKQENGEAPVPAAPVSLLSEIESFCLSHGGTPAQAAAFYAQYDRAGWQANGKPIENWRGLCLNFLRAGGGSGDKGGTLPTALPTQGGTRGYRTPGNARANCEMMRRLLEEDAEREAAEQAEKEAESDE